MVVFKDLTLREGSQVPGLIIGDDAGRAVLEALADLGVECVELAFPRASPRAGWYRHADELGLRTAALARAVEADVEAALAVAPDEVEVMMNSSAIQLEHALGKSATEAESLLVENVERVVDSGVDAGVTLMDAMRAETATLHALARAAVEAGATCITLADTTGSGTPRGVAETVEGVVDAVDGEATVAIHTHDDKGVATANAAVAIDAGAERVDATVAGVGERAGNAPLEEVAVLLAEDDEPIDLDRGDLIPACRRVADALGLDVSPDKPILGDRVYQHESGMHTAAMLVEPATFEPFDPTTYGGTRDLRFGEGTGRGAVRRLLSRVGEEPTDEAVEAALETLRAAAADAGEPLSLVQALDVLREAAE